MDEQKKANLTAEADGIIEGRNAVAVGGRNAPGLAHAELVEFDHVLVGETLALIDRKPHRALGRSQTARNALVLRRQAATGVAHEDHDVGFGNRRLGLIGHFAHDAFALYGLKAAGVDHDVRARPDAALSVLPIAGQSGKISHQRIAAAREAIEKGRFADVGSADQGNYR